MLIVTVPTWTQPEVEPAAFAEPAKAEARMALTRGPDGHRVIGSIAYHYVSD